MAVLPGAVASATRLDQPCHWSAPGGPDEDREDGFKHGGWQAPYFDGDPGGSPAGDPIASKLNNAPKYVASRTLTTLEWNNSHLLQGDVATAVSKPSSATTSPTA